MTNFQSLACALCAALILIGGLHFLIPGGVMEKSVRTVVGMAFLVSVLAACIPAFRGVNPEIVFSSPARVDADDMMKTNAVYVFTQILQSKEIPFSKITVYTDKSEDDGISISKVVIVTDCEEETVRNALDGMDETYEVVICDE